MFVLRNNNTGPYEDPLSIPPDRVHDNKELAYLSFFQKPERIVSSSVHISIIPLSTFHLVILV